MVPTSWVANEPPPAPLTTGYRQGSVLRLQLALVLLDELANLIRHVEELHPLLLVERDRESTQTIHRHAALLADLERHGARRALLECFVLSPKPFDFRLQILVGHCCLRLPCEL